MLMLAAGIAAVVGLVFLTTAAYFFLKVRRERATLGSASGMVVQFHEHLPPSGSSVLWTIVKFTSEKGMVVQFEDREGRRPPRHKIGQSVQVLYDRATPHSAHIDPGSGWTVAAPFVLGGLIGLLISAALVCYGLLPQY
jgi:hypothetical protein